MSRRISAETVSSSDMVGRKWFNCDGRWPRDLETCLFIMRSLYICLTKSERFNIAWAPPIRSSDHIMRGCNLLTLISA